VLLQRAQGKESGTFLVLAREKQLRQEEGLKEGFRS
jgi:hypothetical protein